MNLKLITADLSHSRNIWKWRNDPITRYYSKNKEVISWEDHKSWYRNSLTQSECYLYIGIKVSSYTKYSIGIVRFNISSSNPKECKVSINIAPHVRGKGYGRLLLEEGTIKFSKETKKSIRVIAEVRRDNVASTRLFQSAGYSWIKSTDKDFDQYYLDLT